MGENAGVQSRSPPRCPSSQSKYALGSGSVSEVSSPPQTPGGRRGWGHLSAGPLSAGLFAAPPPQTCPDSVLPGAAAPCVLFMILRFHIRLSLSQPVLKVMPSLAWRWVRRNQENQRVLVWALAHRPQPCSFGVAGEGCLGLESHADLALGQGFWGSLLYVFEDYWPHQQNGGRGRFPHLRGPPPCQGHSEVCWR